MAGGSQINASQLDQAAIPGDLVMRLLGLCESQRVPTHRWFDGTGLDRTSVQEGVQLLSYRQACSFVRRAARALPKGAWGLAWGGVDIRERGGLVGLALRSCETFGDALALWVRHHQAAGSLTDFAVEDFSDEFAIRVEVRERDPELEPFLLEMALSAVVSWMRYASSSEFAPSRVEFAYPQPPFADSYAKFFQCPVLFGAGANRVRAHRSLLLVPMKTPNVRQLALAVHALEARIDVVGPAPGLLSVVRAQLKRDLRSPAPMAQTAERLHMSERTLRRRLASAGRTFAELRDEVRAERALDLLRTTRSPVKTIAAEVGYRDEREFRRAFRRWTGKAPKSFRDEI